MTDTITLGNVIGSLSVIAVLVGFMMNARKIRRENEADAQRRADELKTEFVKAHDTVDDRVRELEITVRDFMPRREIEGRLEHEKVARVAAQQATVDTLREQARVLGDVQREQARFGAKLEASTGAVSKLESSIEKLVGHVNDRLDKMNDCLNAISRKVG